MSDSEEEAPQVTIFNSYSPYNQNNFFKTSDGFEGKEENNFSETRPAYFSEDGTILFNKFNGIEIADIKPDTSIDPDTSIEPYTDIDPYTMVITYKQDTKEKKSFIYNSISSIDHLLSNNLEPFSVQEKQALAREREALPQAKAEAQARAHAQERKLAREAEKKERERESKKRQLDIRSESGPPKKTKEPVPDTEEINADVDLAQASQTSTLLGSPGSPGSPFSSSLTGFGGKKYIVRGGVGGSLVRRISASISDERARQTRESQDNYELHRSFFLIIWEHFAPNDDIRKRPREYKRRHFTIKLPMYTRDGNHVCSVLLRCVTRDNREAGTTNIAYSVLFEFTNHIHWSIFYSFDVHTHDGARIVSSGQVSELHFTLNPCGATPKTRMFFEYTHYINGLITPVHYVMAARAGGGLHLVSLKEDQVQIMGIVSELMLLTMYQLATAKSYATGHIFNNAALTMRQNIDSIGVLHDENELLKIALRHVHLIGCIQDEFRRLRPPPSLLLPSNVFINHLKTDISEAAAGPARPGGGKNINKYLTKINNIKERLKLLKKNKVKNKVKITKLSKSIEELKAKLKKQKEKEKAKLKKQKEKEKAKLKKQKEKGKAKLKKQKEKDNVKRKKTKAKKS